MKTLGIHLYIAIRKIVTIIGKELRKAFTDKSNT